jgi:hypothetical protein
MIDHFQPNQQQTINQHMMMTNNNNNQQAIAFQHIIQMKQKYLMSRLNDVGIMAVTEAIGQMILKSPEIQHRIFFRTVSFVILFSSLFV